MALIKKYVAENFRQFSSIANIIFDALENVIPEAWLSGIVGSVYFIFTIVFGGGFDYFNRSIR
jgi:hypothetical protein